MNPYVQHTSSVCGYRIKITPAGKNSEAIKMILRKYSWMNALIILVKYSISSRAVIRISLLFYFEI
jgi:hypothetical protein